MALRLPRLPWLGKASNIISIAPSGAAAQPVDDFTRNRALIESFSEDYLSMADKAKLFIVKLVAFALPLLAVAAVGTDIGHYFAEALGAFSSYLLAYGVEAGLAGLTLMLGMALQRSSEERAHWVKVGIAGAVWLIASLASGAVMYIIALTALPATLAHSKLGLAVIGLRTGAVMLLDLMSVCILFFRGKSLQRHLADMALKSHAIAETNEAELDIQRAQETAQRRREEDAQYMEDKRRSQALVSEVQGMMGEALLSHARQNLLKGPEDGTNRRVGRY